MNKLLAIVGPTATGKTARAIQESLSQPSIIVSADSRQVYRSMDIVTGKDHPAGIKIYGIDILDPNESSSVSVWYDAVKDPIKSVWESDKQVIVVGGTGLYVRALTGNISTMSIPINQPLRDDLAGASVAQLQMQLSSIDSQKLNSMNHSDQNNPRRLIRALEIAKSKVVNHIPLPTIDIQYIGLRYDDQPKYEAKIKQRVEDRLEQGAITETKNLLAKYSQDLQSMSAIGYKSIIAHLKGEYSKTEMIEDWVKNELSYAKRQMTWFRKQPVIWYDVS